MIVGAGTDSCLAVVPEPSDSASFALTLETTAWRTGGRTGAPSGGAGGVYCSEWSSGTPLDPAGLENNKVRSWSWRSHEESLEAESRSSKSETSGATWRISYLSRFCDSSVGEGRRPFGGLAPSTGSDLFRQVGGGLTTSRGKAVGGEVSGDGGLLLTSFKVDNVSMGDTANMDGGATSTGQGWTLDKQM